MRVRFNPADVDRRKLASCIGYLRKRIRLEGHGTAIWGSSRTRDISVLETGRDIVSSADGVGHEYVATVALVAQVHLLLRSKRRSDQRHGRLLLHLLLLLLVRLVHIVRLGHEPLIFVLFDHHTACPIDKD